MRTYTIGDFIVNLAENYVEVIDTILGHYWKKPGDYNVSYCTAMDLVETYCKETQPSIFKWTAKNY